ncbi:MAG: phage holin family protein [Clostridia bacterium]|nr:phage holin family protein [Clostridia bacterium]
MEILTYITENAIILIPVLIIIGLILKKLEFIPDKYIPLILLPLGVVGAMALGGWTFESAIQGVLVTGAAVYGNQIVKQLRKDE